MKNERRYKAYTLYSIYGLYMDVYVFVTLPQVIKSIKELVLLSIASYKGLAGQNIQSLGWNFVMVKVLSHHLMLAPTMCVFTTL